MQFFGPRGRYDGAARPSTPLHRHRTKPHISTAAATYNLSAHGAGKLDAPLPSSTLGQAESLPRKPRRVQHFWFVVSTNQPVYPAMLRRQDGLSSPFGSAGGAGSGTRNLTAQQCRPAAVRRPPQRLVRPSSTIHRENAFVCLPVDHYNAHPSHSKK